ncbi:DEAD-box ATP-dependent RNA helicase 6 [Platanthera guangdongensis]|uniref:DEAD-box ATP-dependent RNA helicase 6 n=1 Tax=Platanthera guangdongensis TaxID=2320717 RepID=A0ABR2LHY1_9ASPA
MASGISDLEQPKISFSRISKQDCLTTIASPLSHPHQSSTPQATTLLMFLCVQQIPAAFSSSKSNYDGLSKKNHCFHFISSIFHGRNLIDFIPGRHPTDFKFQLIVAILVPTRELSLQASQVCKELRKHLNVQVMVTTGRTSLKDDIKLLYQPAHLIVGTPGQILDQCC